MSQPLTTVDPSRVSAASSFFIAFDKLLRGSRLYEGNGPLVERLADTLMERSERLLEGGDITVRVAPFGLVYAGQKVSEDGDQLSKALFRLFCDGVRELTFRQGLDRDELLALAGLMNTDPKAQEEDLITMLWRKELQHVRYYATDTLQEGVDLEGIEASTLAAASEGAQLRGDATGAEVVLSPDDLRMLKADDSLAWVAGARAPLRPPPALQKTVDLVRESFAVPGDQARFVAMALRASGGRPSPMVLSLYDGLLAARDAAELAALVDAVAAVEEAHPGSTQALRVRMLEEARLEKLAPLYEAASEELGPSLERMSRGARDGLVAVLTRLRPGEAQTRLRGMLEQAGVDLTPFYAARLTSEDTDVVVDAISALGGIGSPAAVSALSVGLGHTLTPIRRAALEAMVGKYDPESRIALGRALRDPDRDNRLLALQVLAKSGDPRVGGLVLSAAQHGSFRHHDEEEQAALIDALAAFPNRRVLGWFTKMLQEKNITRSKAVLSLQLHIIGAAASMGTEEAKELVEVEGKRWHLPKEVKDAATAALRSWVHKDKPDATYTGWTQEMNAMASGEFEQPSAEATALAPAALPAAGAPDADEAFDFAADDDDEDSFDFTADEDDDDDDEDEDSFDFTADEDDDDDEGGFDFTADEDDEDDDEDEDDDDGGIDFLSGEYRR